MSDLKFRAGIVGLGVGQAHARGYLASPDAELVAICDVNTERLQQAGDEWHVDGRYTAYKTMLKEARLDVISICLPNALHAEAAVAALEAGVHVICEKPMAVNVAEARNMIAAAEQNDRRLMVAYNYRYRPDTIWMRNMVQSGALGQVYHASVSWRRETGIPGSPTFGDKALSGGGALLDLGVHVVDLALWALDFPAIRTVTGDTRALFGPRNRKIWGRWWGGSTDNFNVEDGGVGFVRLDGDVSMLINATWAEHAQPQQDDIRVELQGTEGTVVLHIRNYRSEDTLRFYTEMQGEPVTVIPGVRLGGTEGHKAMVIDLLSSLKAGSPASTNGQQGLMAVSLLEALYESSRTGHEIAL